MKKIIDGRKISNAIKEEIKKEVTELKEKTGKIPGLAVVLLGENQASKVYVGSKIRTCEELGIFSEKYHLSEKTTEEELLRLIQTLNKKENIDGILVQLPIPNHISEQKIIDAISYKKDVDGFHPINVGKTLIGDKTGFKSCTPYGIIEMLKRENIEISGKDAVIIGRSNIVGKPMASLLIAESATVQICHSRTKDLAEKTKKADILISAVGKAKFIKKDMIKDGAVVIDVGMNRDENNKLCGDVDFDDVYEKVSRITPVPGGVGLMTVTMLMKNTLLSFKNNRL
ncbi:methenyltetrahydrofolate cyclohydrolase /5,10-methylenetetrahydrofolate dehydrogenase (NADP+) [Hypnocyclicus thermotrophus]|uniref:Bifunctional protein FolD n=1 Tax=Hypnocyclicus thermotrophus TaxID=1627895 RepID=A0AA46I584_9FUSO|nr:bifunctional methylenetetrahydrofolate dehydrogenase/methenyltetrahydrofolate cyclohydrolase FolD [Hypnocyclicus thermotrophus]TDT68620.1 methenyltetrahydrofolate cyclohydrolase /5,10-methylenetetrahydrofolate dehydrogenase (NADP+) [Hypnocyclicus thermotrophus]